MSIRLKKVVRDLLINKSRTILAVAALAFGIAGVGFALTAYAILSREMDVNYMQTNPASIIMEIENVPRKAEELLNKNNLIDSVEIRKEIKARYKTGDNSWIPATLFVVDNFKNIRIDKIYLPIGMRFVGENEILLERAGLRMVKEKEGNQVVLKLFGEKAEKLKYTGECYAPGLPPAWMEGMIYGFITEKSYRNMGGKEELNQIHIVVNKDKLNRKKITESAYKLKDLLEKNGIKVIGIKIPKPGKHPHAGQMNSLLFLVEVLGVLSLILSSILTVNLISAQMSKQKKEIGIMKIIGGSSLQLAGIYINTIFIIGALGLLIGVPIGLIFGNIYANTTASMLNFEITSRYISYWVFLVEIVMGIGVPIMAAMATVLRGSSITINDAIKQNMALKNSCIEKVIERVSIINRPLKMVLKNTIRKRERFILTLLTLAAGGAVFITAMNFRDSLVYTIDKVFKTKNYDIQLTLSKQYSKAEIEKLLNSFSTIDKIKIIGGCFGERVRRDGSSGEKFRITAVPIKESMIKPDIKYGKWLSNIGNNEIVINQVVYNDENKEESIKIGEKIKISIRGKKFEFKVSGIASEPASPPGAYIDLNYFYKEIESENYANTVLIKGKEHSEEEQIKLSKEIEKTFAENGVDISDLNRVSYYKKIVDDHMLIIFVFIMVIAVVIVIVGGMGLASSMGINISERTREIGIMRSVGAEGKIILLMTVIESVLIGGLSWIIAVFAAQPLSIYEADMFGKIFFGTGLDVRTSVTGSVIWLIFVILLSVTATLYPAWKAVRISVKDALRYE